MATLGDIEAINSNITNSKAKPLKVLNTILFGDDKPRLNRNELRRFTGFHFQINTDEYTTKLNCIKDIGAANLTSMCHILNLNYSENTDEVATQILDFLCNLEVPEDDGDDDEEDEDEDVEIEDNGARTEENDDDFRSTNVERRGVPIMEATRDDPTDVVMHNRILGGQTTPADLQASIANIHVKPKPDTFTLSFRDVESSIRTFSGKDGFPVRKWITEFEETAFLLGWNELQKLIFAKKSLSELAKLAVQAEQGVTSWELLKKLLLQEFDSKMNSAEVHKLLMTRRKKKEESLQEYVLVMREIASRGEIDAEVTIQYIVDGIVDDVNNKALLYGATTFEQLKEKMKIYNLIKSKKAHDSKPEAREKKISKDLEQKKISAQEEKELLCYNCGDKGHMARACPSKDKGTKCFACKGFGHKSSECTKTRSRVAAVTTKEKSAAIKSILLNNKAFSALLDTGSDVSLIRLKDFLTLGQPLEEDGRIELCGVGNQKLETLGTFEGKLKIEHKEMRTKLHVVPTNTMKTAVIVGYDVLKKTRVKIDQNGVQVIKEEMPTKMATEEVGNPNSSEDDEVAAILNIEYGNTDRDLSHIQNRTVAQRVEELCRNYDPVKNKTKNAPLKTKIIVKDDIPVYQKPRRLSQSEKIEVDKQIKQWLDAGIIRPSYSEYASPIVLVKKKNGETRICQDFRKLNQKIVQERYPIPNIEDQLDRLEGTKIFTTIDLRNRFFHLPLEDESCKYTAFVTHSGHYEFLKTPFGLSISPASFQRYVNFIFRDLIQDGIILVVMDDIVILARNENEALERFQSVLKRAEEYGLEIQWRKCQFLQSEIEYLGHRIKHGRIQPSKLKTEAVLRFPQPRTVKQIQSFLGLTGYFRKFIRNYSKIAKPLSDLLRKNIPFTFGEEQSQSFEELKRALASEPVLGIYSPEAETELHTDASKDGFGAIILQKNEQGELHPIHYFSKKTSPAESNYCSYELEVLAIIYALKRFRHYLLGIPFKIVTDCAAFTQTMTKKELAVRVARWALLLEEFTYTIEHRPGQRMKHTDALSRNTVLVLNENNFITMIKNAQAKDEKLEAITTLLREGHEYQNYLLKNNILYNLREGRELLVVPTQMQGELIKRIHEENGHFKAKKVEDVIAREFWVPKLREKIKSCVENCIQCILVERKMGKAEGFLHPIQKDDLPLTTYHIDHQGPLTPTKKGYKYLLVVIDGFTKFVWIYPTKTLTAEEVIERLTAQENIFGNPQRIVADRGTAFTSNLFQTYCKERNINLTHITTGAARANGQVERTNRIITPVLAKLSLSDETKWYQHVPRVQWMLNKSYQRSINTNPFELLFGVEMRRPEDVKINEAIQEELQQSFCETREQLRSSARNEILKIQEENRKTFNKRRKAATSYAVGDVVAIKRTQFTNLSKLKTKFLGPYKVTKTKRNDRYDVERITPGEGPQKTSTMAEYMKPWARCSGDTESEADSEVRGRDVGAEKAKNKDDTRGEGESE